MPASRLLRSCLFFFAAASGVHASFDVATAQRELLRRDSEWAETAAAGKDLEKIVSYWTDDALLYTPGQPICEGKAAIRAYVAGSLKIPGFKIHWVSEKPVFSPDGKMAWMRGETEITVPGPNGALMTVHLRGITVWRRDPDGKMRCVADISNDPPPPAKS